MAEFDILVAPILGNETVGQLEPSEFAFNGPVWGGGQFNCRITLPRGRELTQSLKTNTDPNDTMALYVVRKGQILFGGPINYRSRVPGSTSIEVKAQSWKAWTYDRLYKDQVVKTNYDQSQMAIDILKFMQSEPGTPPVLLPSLLTERKRDFTIEPGWSVGKALDSFASRDGGYEWDIQSRYGSSGYIEHYAMLYEVGALRSNQALLMLDQTSSVNRINVGGITEDSTERRSRIWGAGEGTYPDITVVKDQDPYLKDGGLLLREAYMSWSGVSQAQTLFDHARAERVLRNIAIQTVNVEHPTLGPDISVYQPGDRARLRIHDTWDSIDYRGVRITDRSISKNVDKIAVATVTLDLTDVRMDI